MEITEVRIKLMEESGERLQAFCSITFDNCFVIRDLKIIEGANGPFVAMPSRKLTAHCPHCRCKNHLKAAHCNQCGLRLKDDRAVKDEEGRTKLYADIAHPINSACREMIQERVIGEFRQELERAKLPGYVSRYDDFDHEDAFAPAPRSTRPARRDGYADRPADRVVQPTYARPGSEPASHVQTAEPQPRPPHKAAAPAPVPVAKAAAPAVADGLAARSPNDDLATHPTAPKTDAFGAGIF